MLIFDIHHVWYTKSQILMKYIKQNCLKTVALLYFHEMRNNHKSGNIFRYHFLFRKTQCNLFHLLKWEFFRKGFLLPFFFSSYIFLQAFDYETLFNVFPLFLGKTETYIILLKVTRYLWFLSIFFITKPNNPYFYK